MALPWTAWVGLLFRFYFLGGLFSATPRASPWSRAISASHVAVQGDWEGTTTPWIIAGVHTAMVSLRGMDNWRPTEVLLVTCCFCFSHIYFFSTESQLSFPNQVLIYPHLEWTHDPGLDNQNCLPHGHGDWLLALRIMEAQCCWGPCGEIMPSQRNTTTKRAESGLREADEASRRWQSTLPVDMSFQEDVLP